MMPLPDIIQTAVQPCSHANVTKKKHCAVQNKHEGHDTKTELIYYYMKGLNEKSD
jgi:hypothetical protein